MLESLLRVTGDRKEDWKVETVNGQKRIEDAKNEVQKGNFKAVRRLLYTLAFLPGTFKGYKDDNEKLGMPKVDQDEFTKVAIQMDKEDWFSTRDP
jgi:hypothetical protein